jgi:hypothetical protein
MPSPGIPGTADAALGGGGETALAQNDYGEPHDRQSACGFVASSAVSTSRKPMIARRILPCSTS